MTFGISSCLLSTEILMQLCLNQKKAILSPLCGEERMVPALMFEHLIMFGHSCRGLLTQNALDFLFWWGGMPEVEGCLFKAAVKTTCFHSNQKCFKNNSSFNCSQTVAHPVLMEHSEDWTEDKNLSAISASFQELLTLCGTQLSHL